MTTPPALALSLSLDLAATPPPIGPRADLVRLRVRELEDADRHADAVADLPGSTVPLSAGASPEADAWEDAAAAADDAVLAAEAALAEALRAAGLRAVVRGDRVYARRVGLLGRPVSRYDSAADTLQIGDRPVFRAG